MGGIRPWFVDSGPANNDTKEIQLFKSAAKNERVPNIQFAARVTAAKAMDPVITGDGLAFLTAWINKIVQSVKLTVGGKTLWTLTGYQMFLLSMHKVRNIPVVPYIDTNGTITSTIGNIATAQNISIPFHFNQPITKYPSLLAPGVAQLFQASLAWTMGDATAAITTGLGAGSLTATYTNKRLLASLGFERGYYCAPLAFIDLINLANVNTPVPGGFIPNALNVLPGAADATAPTATGELKSYSTPYGEELHGINPDEAGVLFAENGNTVYDRPESFFTPYKFLPPNSEVDEFLPSPNGENLEVATAVGTETMMVERYSPTNEFLSAIVANLGDIVKGKTWQITGLPGIAQSTVPTEFTPYMPRKLVEAVS